VTTYLTRFAYLTAFSHFCLEICISFLPVVYPILITNYDLTYSQVGLIALTSSLFGSLTMPFFGFLSDRFGAGRMVISSIIWAGLLMGLIGLVGSYWAIIVLVGLGALGSAAYHPAGAVLASASAQGRRGAAMSVFSVGGNLGAALSPLWVAVGISWLGLRGTIIVMPVALLMAYLLYQQLSQTDYLQTNAIDKRIDPTPGAKKIQLSIVVGLTLITLIVMARSWFQVSMITYLPEWIQGQGQSIAFGGQVLAVFMIAVGVGSMTGGPLSDRLGRWQVVGISLALMAVAQWLFLNVPLFWQVILVAMMGITIGASFPVTIVMAQETWPSGVGLASSLVMGLGWAPGGLGAWFTGWLADQSSLAFGLQSLIAVPLLGVV